MTGAITGAFEVSNAFEGSFGVEFFSTVLPWLLTFAIVYAVLSNLSEEGIPENDAARATIGIVLAFIITPALSPVIPVFFKMTESLVIAVTAILVLVVLIEILGIRARTTVKTEKGERKQPISIFHKHYKAFSILFVLIAALIFIGTGGLEAAGLRLPSGFAENAPLLFFLGFMALAVWWMVTER